MDLAAYLDRIGFVGEARPDRATLDAVQRAHLLAIPYENLDVALGRPVTIDPRAAFAKIVGARRGGWCYEMNGLLGWALGEIGFCVTRLASAVMRDHFGEAAIGFHLVLRVDLDQETFLADAGLGDGPVAPFVVREGDFTAGPFDYGLARTADGWWRLRNRPGGRPPDFDFRLDLTDEALLAEKCVVQQTDPASIFVQNLICQRVTADGHVQLLGKVLREIRAGEATERELGSADDLVAVLAETFGIDEPAAASLWPRILARHAEVALQSAAERNV